MIILVVSHFILTIFTSVEIESNIHDFHLSKCDIDYVEKESALQISISIFIDDLELALADRGHTQLAICTEREADLAEVVIFDYLSDHLKIKIDDLSYKFDWVGKEVSEDLAAVWCYLQITDISPRRFIEVENDVLMHLFDDQQNVVKIQYDQKKKSFFLFNKDDYSGRMDLEK